MTGYKKDNRSPGQILADRLRAEAIASGDEMGWFEAIYKEAGGDPSLVPWGHEIVRFPLVDWLEKLPEDAPRGLALDVGCGLGDNAAALARAGFDVTAFDLSKTGIKWAAKRFQNLDIHWQQGDLLAPRDEWVGAFDLVTEIFTLQALKAPYRKQAFAQLARLPKKQGGRLLIIARGTKTEGDFSPPPWPLSLKELSWFEGQGYKQVKLEEHFDDRDPPRLHFLCELVRR